MMSNGHKKHSLDAPWKVLRHGPKTYTIDWKGKAYTVSIDRLQPAYMLLDFGSIPGLGTNIEVPFGVGT